MGGPRLTQPLFTADVEAIADVRPDPPTAAHRRTRDPDDEHLLRPARASDVVAPVSGDSHLTELVDVDPPVLTPAAFAGRPQL